MKGKDLSQKLMKVLLVLLAILVIIIAFVGIYLPKLNKLSNIIPDYKLGSEIDGIMEYRFSVDNSENEKQVYVDSEGNVRGEVVKQENSATAEGEEATTPENDTGFNIETRKVKANEEEALTKENFEKSKEIIEKRLKNAEATEYAIRMNDVTGEMVVELSKNDNIDYLYEVALNAKGAFQVIDSQTGVILIDKSHLKNASQVSNYDEKTSTYTVYLQLELDEEGANLLREISKKYIKYTDDSGEEKTDYISVQVDGSDIRKTYFAEEYTSSTLNIPISSGVQASDLNTYAKTVSDIAYTLNNEEIPITYKVNNEGIFVKSNINDNASLIFKIAVIATLVVATVIFIVKYKFKGLLASILNAALIGLVIIVLKRCKSYNFN